MTTKLKSLTLNSFLILAAAICFTSSCKKKNDSENINAPTGNTSTTPSYVSPKPGSLMVNISNLTLHVGGTAQINEALYNSDGSISTTTPGLIWQSANTSYATVTSGLVTAIDTGFTTVTVTDGLHGILVVNVNIVGNGTVIPNTATQVQWSFKGNVLLMQPGTTQTISNYTVYNSAGKVLPSVNLTFVAPSASGLSFSGNSVTAGTTTGSFEVKAVSGTDTLANTLNVVVGAATDTSYSLQVVQGTFPALFFIIQYPTFNKCYKMLV